MVQFQSPVGRLVWGKPGVKQQVKDDNGAIVLGDNGQPVLEDAFGVAFPKAEFERLMFPAMGAAAATVFPSGPPANFRWKYVDGDAATGHTQGKPYNQREGYPGCYVMAFKTRFDVPLFRPSLTVPNQWDQITANEIKTGDYIAVSGSFDAHVAKNARSVPGLYTNPQGVMLIGIGPAIMNAPDAATMFGGMQYQLPPGATAPGAAPAMPGGMATPPGMAPQPMPGQVPGYAPQPAAYAGAGYAPQPGQPAPAYAPAHDFVQAAMGQPQPVPGAPTPGFPPR